MVVRRALFTLFGIHMVFATFSGYRAIVQVKSLDVTAPAAMGVGSTMRVHVVSWNRTHVTMRLTLEQGTTVDTLAIKVIPSSGIAAWNPIPQHGTIAVTLDAHTLSRFHSGDAVLRATAIGRPQWMRTPPPTVQAQRVQLRVP